MKIILPLQLGCSLSSRLKYNHKEESWAEWGASAPSLLCADWIPGAQNDANLQITPSTMDE